jgi:hypothetical protein
VARFGEPHVFVDVDLAPGIGIQCLFIVGLTLVALQLLSGQRKLETA